MEKVMDNDVIQLDGSMVIRDTAAQVKSFTDKEKKNSCYHHILATEGVWQYLNDNDLVNGEPINLRSSAKFLYEFEVSDIQLPNMSIYVRAVYDEDLLFVPKMHFEHNLTPDFYLFVKLSDDLKTGKILGYVRPDWINKKNDNGQYYFVNKSFLKPFKELMSLIKNYDIKEQYVISDRTEETLEKFIMLYLDNAIEPTKLNKLVDYLKNSSIAREKLVEFENFERLSNMALQEFKDLDVDNNDFSKYIKTLVPTDEFSDFEIKEDLNNEETTVDAGGLFIDDDLIKENIEPVEENFNDKEDNLTVDEFEIFENNSEEENLFENSNIEDEISVETDDSENIVASQENYSITEQIETPIVETAETEIESNETIDEAEINNNLSTEEDDITPSEENLPSEDSFDNASVGDNEISDISDFSDDENVFVPEDLELNILDDINEYSDNLDAETVIGLTEDTLYNGDEAELNDLENKIDNPEEDFREFDLITTDEVDQAIANVDLEDEQIVENDLKEDDLTETESIDSGDDTNWEISEEVTETKEEDVPISTDNSSVDDNEIFFDKGDDEIINFNSEITSEEPVIVTDDEVTDEEVTDENVNDTEVAYTEDEISDFDENFPQNHEETSIELNEIYNNNSEESPIELPEEIENSSENSEDFDFDGTDFAFATDKTSSVSKKIVTAISAAIFILCVAGVGAWYFFSHGKSSNNIADINNDMTTENEITDFNFDNQISEQTNSDIDTTPAVTETKDKDVVANVNIPSVPSLGEPKNSEQLTIQKIKKDFSQPDTYVSVSKIIWDVPEYLTYNDDFNSYLQTIGSSLKVNLSSDLLLINENPILNNVKIKVSLKDSGKSYAVDLKQGCGTEAIDELVLQSVKKTMDLLKPPVNSFDTADEDLYLTICL